MIYEIGKNITEERIIDLINPFLQKDTVRLCSNKSLFYILTTIRRGGYIIKDNKDIFVFAKNYDKNNSYSLTYLSNLDSLTKNKIQEFKEKINTDLFLHHLPKSHAEKQADKNKIIIMPQVSKKINSYSDEDTFPQIILSLRGLPNKKSNAIYKENYLAELLGEKKDNRFKRSIHKYVTSTQKNIGNQSKISIMIDKNTTEFEMQLIKKITSKVIDNYKKHKKNKSPGFDDYQLDPIIKLVALLTNKKVIEKIGNEIVFRAQYNFNSNTGGFWIGEYMPTKSLLIPHIFLSDLHYKEQVKFLLYDIICFAYLKNIDYINLSGSEDEELYKLKILPKQILTSKHKELVLHTIYIEK